MTLIPLKIAIIGLGKIGGSLALALGASGLQSRVYDTDVSLTESLAGNDGLTAADSIEHAVAGSDVVFVATPVRTIIDSLPRIAAAVKPDTVVIDTGSTKCDVVAAMDALDAPVCCIGGHPLAGNDRTGRDAWDKRLFRGRTFAFVRTKSTTDRAAKYAAPLAVTVGAKPYWTDAQTHDEIVALTSQLPILNAVALARLLSSRASDDAVQHLSGGQLAAATRMAESPESMLRDIIRTNHVLLEEASEALGAGIRALLDADDDTLEQLLTEAAAARRRIMEGS